MTQLVTLKLDDGFLSQVDKVAKKHGYHSRTEFIRAALREKMDEMRMQEQIYALRGMSKHRTTDEEYELHREQAFARNRPK